MTTTLSVDMRESCQPAHISGSNHEITSSMRSTSKHISMEFFSMTPTLYTEILRTKSSTRSLIATHLNLFPGEIQEASLDTFVSKLNCPL